MLNVTICRYVMNKLGTKINLVELFEELDKDRNDVIDYTGNAFNKTF